MEQEYIPLPEEFSPPPENRPPEEYPAADPSADGIPPRAKMSRAKYLLVAGLLLTTTTLTAVTGGSPNATRIEIDPTGTSWECPDGTIVHFEDEYGWFQKGEYLHRFGWWPPEADELEEDEPYHAVHYETYESPGQPIDVDPFELAEPMSGGLSVDDRMEAYSDGTIRIMIPAEDYKEGTYAKQVRDYVPPEGVKDALARPTAEQLSQSRWFMVKASGSIYLTQLQFGEVEYRTDGLGFEGEAVIGFGSGGSSTLATYRGHYTGVAWEDTRRNTFPTLMSLTVFDLISGDLDIPVVGLEMAFFFRTDGVYLLVKNPQGGISMLAPAETLMPQ